VFFFAMSAKAFNMLDVSGAEADPRAGTAAACPGCTCCWSPPSGMKLGAGVPSGVVDSMSKEENVIHQKKGFTHPTESPFSRASLAFVHTFKQREFFSSKGHAYFEILAHLAFL
jgi:hypothetical protein